MIFFTTELMEITMITSSVLPLIAVRAGAVHAKIPDAQQPLAYRGRPARKLHPKS